MTVEQKQHWNSFFETGMCKASKLSMEEIEAIRSEANSRNPEVRAFVEGVNEGLAQLASN